jgi:hypothetical protein
VSLAAIEAVLDRSGVASSIEMAMPAGGRPRQLPVRTLLVGIVLTLADHRPALLSRVHAAHVGLSHLDKVRLGVIVVRRGRSHELTYRQVEYAFSVMVGIMDCARVRTRCRSSLRVAGADELLSLLADEVLEATIPERFKALSSSLAVDWTDHESFSRAKRSGEAPGQISKPASVGATGVRRG